MFAPAKFASNSVLRRRAVSSGMVSGAVSIPLGRLMFWKNVALLVWMRLPCVALMAAACSGEMPTSGCHSVTPRSWMTSDAGSTCPVGMRERSSPPSE